MSPVWSPVGDELFYRGGGRIMAVPVSVTDTELRFGTPEPVYEGRTQPCCTAGGWGRTFDVGPDGQRFVVVRVLEDSVDVGVPNVPRIHMAQGWLQEVERQLGVR